MTININGFEYIIETKVYYSPSKFTEGKKQLAYYCKDSGLTEGVYLVFIKANKKYPEAIKESKEVIEGVEIKTYLVEYDDEKW
jgi:hypothetical protein